MESGDGVLDESLVVALQDRLASEEEGGFGEIGENPVRAVAELRHLRGEVVAETGVELAAVGHHGVDDSDRAGGGAVLHDREDRGDLRFADVAGVEGVEGQLLPEPFGFDGRHFARQVVEGPRGEAGGVVGENGAWKHGAFDAAGRDERQGDRRGTLSDAGDVLDGEKAGKGVHSWNAECRMQNAE